MPPITDPASEPTDTTDQPVAAPPVANAGRQRRQRGWWAQANLRYRPDSDTTPMKVPSENIRTASPHERVLDLRADDAEKLLAQGLIVEAWADERRDPRQPVRAKAYGTPAQEPQR